MAMIDELEMERVRNLVGAFGWRVKRHEIHETTIEMVLEKKREEPEQEITVQPT